MRMNAFKVEDLGYHGVAADVTANGSDGGKRTEQNMSPGRARHELKVELPSSCDPPGPNNPPKQLVWIVSQQFSFLKRVWRWAASVSVSIVHDIKAHSCAEI
jgi:hypothetical protein